MKKPGMILKTMILVVFALSFPLTLSAEESGQDVWITVKKTYYKTAMTPSFVAQNGVKKELYVSLSGVPQTAGGPYESGAFSPVGMATIYRSVISAIRHVREVQVKGGFIQ